MRLQWNYVVSIPVTQPINHALLLCLLGIVLLFWPAESRSQPIITSQPTNQTVTVGGPAAFSVQVSGTAPYTYQWRFKGVDINSKIGWITTVAGTGTAGYSGDGGAATKAQLAGAAGVNVDGSGNLFIADISNFTVRKVDSNGIITTVAGTGMAGYSGDGGMATSAKLCGANYVIFDQAGNLFIEDLGNSAIRKVDTNGILTTVVGTGVAGYSGDGGVATNDAGVAVAGNFAFLNSSLKPNFGVTNVSCVFTPVDVADYNSVTGMVAVTVGKAASVLARLSATTIFYGKTYWPVRS